MVDIFRKIFKFFSFNYHTSETFGNITIVRTNDSFEMFRDGWLVLKTEK